MLLLPCQIHEEWRGDTDRRVGTHDRTIDESEDKSSKTLRTQIKRAMSTIITVDETKSERRIVSQIDTSMMDENESFLALA
jgi:hypothetical protein